MARVGIGAFMIKVGPDPAREVHADVAAPPTGIPTQRTRAGGVPADRRRSCEGRILTRFPPTSLTKVRSLGTEAFGKRCH